jgi:hypothetical protein
VTPRRVLVVEDGHEYSEAFTRLASAPLHGVVFERAGSLAEARAAIASRPPDALFIDVVFDRVPESALTGDVENLIARFGGDRGRALRHLVENQGFYVLDALAPLITGLPVVLAYDFSAEPRRLEALCERVPLLSGLPDGISIAQALEALLPGEGLG